MWLPFAFPVVNGAAIAGAVVAVTRSSLSPFAQAIILAIVSASIGALGIVAAAMIAARASQRVLEAQRVTQDHVKDVAAAVGADRRQSDRAPDDAGDSP